MTVRSSLDIHFDPEDLMVADLSGEAGRLIVLQLGSVLSGDMGLTLYATSCSKAAVLAALARWTELVQALPDEVPA